MKNDLYQVQEAIEQQSRAATIQRFEADLTDKIQKNEQSATYYGTALSFRLAHSNMDLSWQRLTTEADKCHLLCANCHRIVHYEKDQRFLK